MARLYTPFQPLAPSETGMVATRLRDGLNLLKTMGVAVGHASRLHRAVRALEAVHKADHYPTDESSLIEIGNAIKLAFQLVRVIEAVDESRPPAIIESLRRASKGNLSDTHSTDAHRAQSELYVGLVLAASGTSVGAPRPGSRKSPDYVVEVDTARFSVEVKRPGSQSAIKSRIAEAVHQTSEYASYPSVLALDVSDLLPVSTGVRDVAVTEAHNKNIFRAATDVARRAVMRRVSEIGYSRVCVLFCFAESFLWEAPVPHPIPKAAAMMYAEVFPDAYQGLIVDQSQRLRLRLVRGFEELGGGVRLFHRV